MNKIQIVLNSDRCHCSVNGTPAATFVYSNYEHKTPEANKGHAINDAKIQCFNELARFHRLGVKAQIDTNIVRK